MISVYQAAAEIIDALEASGLDYAVGGALAYTTWGTPRATNDIDFNLFVELDHLDAVFDVIERVGIAVDRDALRTRAAAQGMFVVRHHGYAVDVFIPSIDFSWEAARTKKRASIAHRQAWVLSAEAIAVFKLLFFRGKDIIDLERLIGVQQERLDYAYIRRHIVDMMGEDDERVKRWDALWQEHGPKSA